MHTTLILASLLACGGSEPPAEPAPTADAPAAPAPVTTPPQPETLPPPAPPAGGPRVMIPGNYLPSELEMTDGEAVRVICGDKLVDGRVSLIEVGEGRVTVTVPQCPKFQILFRGLDDRMGAGSISQGIGRGPFGAAKPRDWEAAHGKGVFSSETRADNTEYAVFFETDGVGKQELFTVKGGTGTAGLNWIGDLDDDNVPDFVLNTPHDPKTAHLRLFLSAKSATRKPEQVAEFVFTLW